MRHLDLSREEHFLPESYRPECVNVHGCEKSKITVDLLQTILIF